MNVEEQITQASKLGQSGDWAQAIELYDGIVDHCPDDPNATYAKNCAAELRERQRMALQPEDKSQQFQRQGFCVDGRDVLIAKDAERPGFCFSCAATTDLCLGSVRLMAHGIPLITFDKDFGTFYLAVCRQCRKKKWRTRVIGILSLLSVVLFPIGAFLLLRRWHFTTAWYNGKVIRIRKPPKPFRDAISNVPP